MWNQYIANANETSVSKVFSASNKAVKLHNNEVYELECRISDQQAEIKNLRDALDKAYGIIALYDKGKKEYNQEALAKK